MKIDLKNLNKTPENNVSRDQVNLSENKFLVNNLVINKDSVSNKINLANKSNDVKLNLENSKSIDTN